MADGSLSRHFERGGTFDTLEEVADFEESNWAASRTGVPERVPTRDGAWQKFTVEEVPGFDLEVRVGTYQLGSGNGAAAVVGLKAGEGYQDLDVTTDGEDRRVAIHVTGDFEIASFIAALRRAADGLDRQREEHRIRTQLRQQYKGELRHALDRIFGDP